MEKNTEEKGLSILDLFHAIKKHIIAIVAIVLVCSGLGAIYVKFFNPVSYQATTIVYASYTGETGNASGTEGLNYGRLAPKTFSDALNKDKNIWILIENRAEEIIKSNDEFNEYERSETFYKSFTYKTVGSGLVASYDDKDTNTFYFKLSFKHSDRSIIAPVIEATIDVLYDITDKANDNENLELFKYFAVSHLGEGKINNSEIGTVKTSSKKLLVLAGGVGLVLAACYVLLYELLDQKITSRKTIEELCDLKIVGLIPDLIEAQNRGGKLYGKKNK